MKTFVLWLAPALIYCLPAYAGSPVDSLIPAADSSFVRILTTTDQRTNTATFTKIFDHKKDELLVIYQDDTTFYGHPKKFGFARNIPDDLYQIAKSPFEKRNFKGLLITAAATAALIPFDQKLLNGVRSVSQTIHLNPQTDYKVLLKAGTTKLFMVPRNTNSLLYQLGQGGTSMILAGGMWIFGKFSNDYRALQTASDMAEAFATMGVTTQVLKRITGRQSPFMIDEPGGDWYPFPSFRHFQMNTSNFDAFPSGHLATLMSTITILSLNYPEKKWIKPVGYSIMGMAAWAMMNTEVHWAGDYPLAIALGYLSGRISHDRHLVHRKIYHPIIF